jgi:hypothetical protein
VIFVADIRATSSGNTTPLGAGEGTSFTARDFRDTNAKMISQTIARENYRSKTLSNAKLGELRKYVFKMVTGWTNDTKMRIISEYGDMSQLRSSNPEEVNRQVTETLIINLKPEDAEILLRDIKVNERKLYSDVSSIQRSRTKLSSQYRRLSRFSAKTMNEVAADLGASFRVNKLRRELRRYDVTFKIPKNVINQFKRLRKELIDVLNDLYNRVEMNNLALRMDIDIPDRINQRQLRNLIINKTLLYVSLIVGKTRKGYANAFLATQPFEELLRYTSYSYVTGKPPVTDEEIRQKMAIAAKAKTLFSSKKAPIKAGYAAARETKVPGVVGTVAKGAGRLASRTAGAIGTVGAGLVKGAGLGIAKGAVKGAGLVGKGLGALAGSAADSLLGWTGIPDLARGIGKLTGKLGSGIGKLGSGIVGAVSNTVSNIKSDAEKSREYKRQLAGKSTEEIAQLAKMSGLSSKDANASEIARKMAKEGRKAKTPEAMDLFKKKKEILEKKGQEMGKDIPYVGVSESGITNKDISKAVPVYVINEWMKQRAAKAQETEGTNKEIEGLKKEYEDTGKGLFKGLFGGKKRKELGAKITELEYDKMSSLDEEIGSESDSSNGSFWDKMTINIGQAEEVNRLKANQAIKVYDMSALRLRRDQEKEAIDVKNTINGFDKVKKELATPVFVINKQESIKDILIAIANKFGLGELATSFASENAGELVSRLTGLSTGGRGRYVGGNKTSQFISGDSRNKSPNPEQVSINWDRKTYNVKPIPQFADGGSQRATSGQITRMTAGERNMPMSVGISSHTITYNRSLGKDVKDNGSNEALKVYSVNPGLSDLLEVNGKSVSAIGLMSDMTDRLSRIEGLLAIGNEQRNAVATATAALIPKLANKSGGSNPFAGGGFTSELDDILKGR